MKRRLPARDGCGSGGDRHLGLRVAAAEARIDAEALAAQPGDPELFSSYDQMAAAQADGQYRPEVADANRRRAQHGQYLVRQS